MKKNIIKLFLVVITITIIFSGCFKYDDMQGINIITTVYPLEYVTNKLYGENSVVNSIYPDGTDTNTYKYRLEITGRMPNAETDSFFIYLSNVKEITFDQAYKAAGISSDGSVFPKRRSVKSVSSP